MTEVKLKMTETVSKFVDAVIDSGTYQPLDRIYVTNRVLGLVGDGAAVDAKSDELLDIVDALLETAVKNGKSHGIMLSNRR